MRNRKFLLLLVVPLVILALAGITVLGVVLARALFAIPANVGLLARYMPADTDAFFSLQLHPQGADSLTRARKAFEELNAGKEGAGQGTLLGQKVPFDWQADVEPWVGDTMAVGFTDLAPLWETVRQQSISGFDSVERPRPPRIPFLLAVEVRDVQRLRDFQERLRAELSGSDQPVTESSYRETTIWTIPVEETPIAFALRDDRVLLLANDRALVEQALDRAEADSLAANPDYITLLGRLPSGGLALGYLDYRSLTAGLREAMAGQVGTAFPQTWGVETRAMGLTLLADPDGLRLVMAARVDMAALAQAGLQDLYQEMHTASPGRVLRFLPTGTALAATGQNVRGLWKMYMLQTQQMSPESYSEIQRSLDDLFGKSGLNLEEDILPWMGGEYALFVGMDDQLLLSAMPFHVGLIFETSDPDKARQAMAKVEGLLAEEGDTTFVDQEIEGVQVRVARTPGSTDLLPGYAFVDNFLVIALDERAFQAAFQANRDGGKRLESSAEFRTVVRALPGQRSGLVYLDIKALGNLVSLILSSSSTGNSLGQVRSFLGHFGAVGIADEASRSGDDIILSTIFLHVVR